MSFNGKTFKFMSNGIKSKCRHDNSKFAGLIMSYIINELEVGRKEITDSLDFLDSYMNDE